MLRLRLQKLGSILGLLAILMTVFAPAVSQALASHERVDALLHSYCSVDNPSGDLQADHTSSTPSLPHLQACGYCHFFSHAPAVQTANASFAPVVWIDRAPRLFAPVLPSARPILSAALPRAPPLKS
ncbi:DUF2946 domain-containing protein [Paraburkholderia sp. C35]|uniref:DUF2946 domain-containing protein n=1 Tax=Paraburkholderia sp. C35 TaxID=2126993 RepID=UPI000D68A35D|nr:DUF2946 domain-containing protein [Paraburkholderia sp. C35]